MKRYLPAAAELLQAAPAVDLHCDTLGRALDGDDLRRSTAAQASPTRLRAGGIGVAVYALWVPPHIGTERGWEHATRMMNHLRLLGASHDDVAITPEAVGDEKCVSLYPALEDGRLLSGHAERIAALVSWGVRYVTLTWNTGNKLATSWQDLRAASLGLTEEGRTVIEALDAAGVRVDISHLSDEAAREVLAGAARLAPLATHSCSRALRPHARNLPDELARAVADRGGVIGVNFHRPLLAVASGEAGVWDAVAHIEHFWRVAGEEAVAIGSDFDGIPSGPVGLERADRLPRLFAALLSRGHARARLRRFARGNALRALSLAEGRSMGRR